MTTFVLLLALFVLAAVSPWLGADSRDLPGRGNRHAYPGLPDLPWDVDSSLRR